MTVAPSDGLGTTLNDVVYFLSMTRCAACDDRSREFIKFF